MSNTSRFSTDEEVVQSADQPEDPVSRGRYHADDLQEQRSIASALLSERPEEMIDSVNYRLRGDHLIPPCDRQSPHLTAACARLEEDIDSAYAIHWPAIEEALDQAEKAEDEQAQAVITIADLIEDERRRALSGLGEDPQDQWRKVEVNQDLGSIIGGKRRSGYGDAIADPLHITFYEGTISIGRYDIPVDSELYATLEQRREEFEQLRLASVEAYEEALSAIQALKSELNGRSLGSRAAGCGFSNGSFSAVGLGDALSVRMRDQAENHEAQLDEDAGK